jgi:uncharacterized protein YprB with RNaseH-like and TPR domain
MTSFGARMARAGFASEETTQLISELRRRIERMEQRPPDAKPRLPPHSVATGPARATLREQITTRVSAQAKIGTVAPADAMIARPDVAAPLAGLPLPASPSLLHGLRILDIETTGLSGGTGTLAFLVGIGAFESDGTLAIHQLVLPSPAAEGPFLDRMLSLLAGATLLVTFNGRSFDVPLLRTRCILARRAPHALTAPPHLDLLGIARRLWRGRAADCRLVTLEERVLRRRRVEDLPGSMAPLAYTAYLRGGDPSALDGIVEHNRDDIAGTAALLAAALRILDDPHEHAEDAGEMLAVAEHRLRLGDVAEALPLLHRAVELARTPETRRRALTQLARVHRRAGRLADARAAWERYRADFPRENLGYIELAKLLEHGHRDPIAALAVASSVPHTATDEVQKRLARLRRRAGLFGRNQIP